MTDIYLPKEVVDKNGRRVFVTSVNITDGEESHDIKLDNFLETYEEYVDPKDVEIARLNQQIADLKVKGRKHKKPRRMLTKDERLEIEVLISNGETNRPIATQYDISETTISKIRVAMRKGGEDV